MSSDQALWILACSWAPQKVIFITLLSLVAQKIRTFSDLCRVHFHNWEKTLGNQRGLERSYKVLLTNIKRSILKWTKNDQSKKWNGIEWQNRRPCIYNISQNILPAANIFDWSKSWLNYLKDFFFINLIPHLYLALWGMILAY